MSQLPDEITLRNLSDDELIRWVESSDSPVIKELCMRLELSQMDTPVEPITRRFKDLPKGTRFKYPGSNRVWVVLEAYGNGLIASWEGIDTNKNFQSICSFGDGEWALESEVYVV